MAFALSNISLQAICSSQGTNRRVLMASSYKARSANYGNLQVSCSQGAATGLPEEGLEISPRLGKLSFPSRFLFGAATAAYQVEGADFGGRGECIWNTFCKNFPEKIADGSNGGVAADSYHRYKEDVKLLVDMGMDAYRFSISWPRILTDGRSKRNEEGIQYYKNLLEELHDNGIEPFVTLFHWDVPQYLEDEYGGFRDKRIVEDFTNYARICFKEFGHRVKHWITANEPWTFATVGYGQGIHAPGRCSSGIEGLNCPAGDSLREPYIVSHNILLAHAEVVKLYREEFQLKQHGKIGITLVSHWYVPYDSKSPLDQEAQRRGVEFNLGWYMDPLKFGDYPFSMRTLVGERLPTFTPEEAEKVKDSYDFIGLNYYTARYAQHVSPTEHKLSTYNDDIYANILVEKNGVPIEHAEPGSWINVYPRGLRELLLYIRERYENPEIFITENGVMEHDDPNLELSEAIVDTHRTEYLALHLHELTEAMRSEANVRGYFTWSLLDNFEWQDGYTSRLGLHYIDYKDKRSVTAENGEIVHPLPDRTRTPKHSANWFKRFLSIKSKRGMAFGSKD